MCVLICALVYALTHALILATSSSEAMADLIFYNCHNLPGAAEPGRGMTVYSVVPGNRNWEIETSDWIYCALESRWLGGRKPCGTGLFYRKYRPLLEETGWLGADYISKCLETRWLGQNLWFLFQT